ncbi:MAG: type III restriction endonuclease [Chthonomonas sp.]
MDNKLGKRAAMDEPFFQPRPAATPTIYAFAVDTPGHEGLLKIGYTEGSAKDRIAQQFPGGFTGYDIKLIAPAMRPDGTSFTDRDVHRHLKSRGVHHETNEWFRCTVQDVQAAILAVRDRISNEEDRTLSFGLRPEQEKAVELTAEYFRRAATEQKGHTPHFLWNAKMRFGKTFAAYQLAKRMGWKKVLVLTFKPAVKHAWAEDLQRHIDFEGWQFVSRDGAITGGDVDLNRPVVCFGSFQDYLQLKDGAIKPKNEWVHAMNWDCVILDEYHFGAWRENAKGLFGGDEEDAGEVAEEVSKEERAFDEDIMPITTRHYLYLSGTPFRALASGEFIEEQIYNWTYSDEQRAKRDWTGPGPNPYGALPRLVLMTYKLPDDIREVAEMGEFNEFDLNEFFRAKGDGADAKFEHEEEVQKWLDMIRGAYRGTTVDDLKLGRDKPPMPFGDTRLMAVLNHTFWFLPSVASCRAMANLLKARQNVFYHDFKVVVAAGAKAGIGADALPPVQQAMGDDPLSTRTITLSCGKLTTGVTVRPWAGIFMLRKCSSPETYFQSAFRVQSPWTVNGEEGSEIVVKPECYVFDFAPNRALRQIADYGSRLATDATTPEERVAELIGFLPVLAYDGSAMRQLDAEAILDMATAGTSATLLAKRWESVLLVNVDDTTLNRLMQDAAAMAALMSIEGFRNLNSDLETIINRSEQIKDTKRKMGEGGEVSEKEKRELTEAEKERKSLRKQVQEKLLKFAARIPVFMYLTDYREQTLRDVITRIEPRLFQKVTNLTTADFERLVNLGVFNSQLMNDAVWKFRRYEDASLRYAGIERHRPLQHGLWDTTLSEEDFQETFSQLAEE